MSNVNNLLYGLVNGSGGLQFQVPVSDSVSSIAQGDLVYWDGTAHLAKVLDSDAHAATLLGVALQPSKVSSSIDNSSAPAEKAIQVGALSAFELKTTAAETYYTGTKVYLGADQQTVTTVAGTNAVGYVALPSNVSSVTGASGVKVPVVAYHKAFLPLQA